jgi:ribonuclease-3
MTDFDAFQRELGVSFDNTDLMQEALTHRSYVNEHNGDELADNERLEFLGDAVLDFLIADMLYVRFPEMPEGDLTRLRAALVRTEALAELALDYHLGVYLLMGKGEASSGGRQRETNLCRVFEAVIGALYLDQGLEAVKTFVSPPMTRLLDRVLTDALHIDARSRLQEWSQALHNITPTYRLLEAVGPDHAKEFRLEVLLGDKSIGQGAGKSKQAAAQAAARSALRLIDEGKLSV